MATILRNTDPMARVIADQSLMLAKRVGAGSSFHLDASERTVSFSALSGSGSTNEAAAIAAANQLRAVYVFHLADTVGHKVADSPPSLTAATDLATAYVLANAIKADYNAHRASTTYHYTADSTNAISSADASDLASLQTLLNEAKTDLNAHMASAPTGSVVRLVNA